MICTPISRLHAVALALSLAAAAIVSPSAVMAAEVPVRHQEGALSGFLSLRTLEGKTLALGDLVQVTHGDRITTRVTFHFKDGSLDDETTVVSQRRTLRLISNHHVQSGPIFPHPADVMIHASTGQVVIRSLDKDGKEKVTSEHMDLPSDLGNGMMLMLLKNLDPATAQAEVSYLSPGTKPRLIKLAITREGADPITVGGLHRKAVNFCIKPKLGGIVGLVAPLVGKQPEDIHVWMVGKEVPAFLGYQGQRYEGGPLWRIESAVPSWPIQQ